MKLSMNKNNRLPKLEGKKFGKLIVLNFYDRNQTNNKHRWLCRCECGKESIVIGENLMSGQSQSCGCLARILKSQRILKNLQNQQFGKLTVIKRYDEIEYHHAKWCCKCSCGKEIIAVSRNLLSGKTTHCGCSKIKKPKINKRNRPEMSTSLYTNWRKLVYERDKYKCIICGNNKKLNAHHLNGWHWAIEERYSIDNGITLCSGPDGCHDKFHQIYGRKNNTKQQFIEFIQKCLLDDG